MEDFRARKYGHLDSYTNNLQYYRYNSRKFQDSSHLQSHASSFQQGRFDRKNQQSNQSIFSQQSNGINNLQNRSQGSPQINARNSQRNHGRHYNGSNSQEIRSPSCGQTNTSSYRENSWHRQQRGCGYQSFMILMGMLTAFLLNPASALGRGDRRTALEEDVAPYVFPEFPYKETVANEKEWSEYESACSQAPGCILLEGLMHTRCVRDCIAPACYSLLYRPDELEEGEIDVRLNSFKGCFLKKVVKPRRP